MSNSIDCSTMFALPNPADVTITRSAGKNKAHGEYIVKDTKTGSVIWFGSFEQCERMRTSYIETGV